MTSSSKVYRGNKDRGISFPCVVTVEEIGAVGKVFPLLHRMKHSPDGFGWGYGGSGPADLARSILWDHLGREPMMEAYIAFKWEMVAKFPESWKLSTVQIAAWYDAFQLRLKALGAHVL